MKTLTVIDRLSTSFNLTALATILQSTVDWSYARAKRGQDVVFLGRDAWPCAALARSMGLRAKYFHISSLQLQRVRSSNWRSTVEPSTLNRWRMEIAPDALVIDTGYAGSILNALKVAGESIDGALMSSSGSYPQILSDSESLWVGALEDFPKLHARCIGYDRRGIAQFQPYHAQQWASTELDEADLDSGELPDRAAYNHHLVVSQELLRACGIKDVSSRILIGRTPEERVGLAGNRLFSEYHRIKALRS